MRKYVIQNKTYGRALIGRTIYYVGFKARPKFLKEKGQGFSGGKHLLETLDKKYKGRYELVLTRTKDEIERMGRKYRVSVSEKTLRRFDSIVRERSRDIKLDAAHQVLSTTFAADFTGTKRVETYRRGMLASLLVEDLDPRSLSIDDQRALTTFATKVVSDPRTAGYDEREAVSRKRDVQLLHLKRLIAEFDARLPRNLPEADWQQYFEEKILFFQDSYIRKIHKPNIAVVTTQFPDFGVITADDYLDLLEIKLPKTPLLSEDKSHNSFYWTAPVAQAIAQGESYIDAVSSRRADIILQIEKLTGLRLRIVKPRGIIVAGSTTEFQAQPGKIDYFRMLNEGLKNIEIVPYDELSQRLKNTVVSIERLESESRKGSSLRKPTARKRPSAR
jgi:hypothetical protein